ncbi:zinc finger protein RFP-like [Salminus brasiliensis]|uniref:zinc finger protein RFP-like n=1 Tax=Salminus brasiliensis TaxID=930266 RepID=UPI003B837B97
MEQSITVAWEEELKCCICLDVLTDPVSTPCGHNFCLVCIEKCWTSAEDHYCPFCKEKFNTKPELKISTTFRAVVHHLQGRQGCSKPAVACDVCSGQKRQAVKSCLDCGTTFCKIHLENHKTAPRLIKHKLIDPVENLQDYICRKHERPLELFCRDDQMCVCQFCTEGDHKTHSTVPVEQESGEKKKHIVMVQEEVQQMIKNRQKKIEDILSSVQRNKNINKKSKAHTLEVFRALVRCMERSQAELLEVMEEKRKAAERQAEEFIKELEQEITELKRRDTELEQLSHTEDHLHLLQMYPSVCSPPSTKNRTDIRINTPLNMETLRRALSQLQKALSEEMERLSKTTSKSASHKDRFRNSPPSSTTTSSSTASAASPFGLALSTAAPAPFTPVSLKHLTGGLGELQRQYAASKSASHKDRFRNSPPSSTTTSSSTASAASPFGLALSTAAPAPFTPVSLKHLTGGLGELQRQYAVNVTLDPNTAYTKLILSADGKQVWHGYTSHGVPNNPERFDTTACVLGKEGFCSGRFYYEVQVRNKTAWVLGVVLESINRKGVISVSPENGYWTVHRRNVTEYLALESPPVHLSLKQAPQKVGVFVDYEEGLVSFYDVEASSHIYSFTGQYFNKKLYPFFFPCNKGDGLNPMTICSVTRHI